MTRFFALAAVAVIGATALASAGASAHGFGGPPSGFMGSPGPVVNLQKVDTRPFGNTIESDKLVLRKIEIRDRRDFLRDFFWRHHRHVIVKPLMLGPGPALIP